MALDQGPEGLDVPGLRLADQDQVVETLGLRHGHTVYRGLSRHPGWEK
jgi:hypothetical protein